MNDLQLYNPTKGAMIGVERKEHLGQKAKHNNINYQTNDCSCHATFFLSLKYRGSGSPLNIRGAYQEAFVIEGRSVLHLRLLRPLMMIRYATTLYVQ